MGIAKRAFVRCVVGGRMAPGAGWAAAGHARQLGHALSEPVREVALQVDLEQDPGGFLMIVTSDDPSIWCDDWFATQEEAEGAAATWYGVRSEDWKAVGRSGGR